MFVDLAKIKRIYFIGIKGVAMTGLAVICQKMGKEIFGSDVAEKFITDKILEKNQIKSFENFSITNLNCQPDLVVLGTSFSDENPEVIEAKKRKIKIIFDSELRGLLSQKKETIAVAGIHGKTTTTAMLAYLFSKAGLKPSYLIGTGAVPDLGGNSDWGVGDYFIVEGDEYSRSKYDTTPKFLDLEPKISVITNIEWEHVDIYPDLSAVEKAFTALVEKTKDLIVVCGDWPSVKKIIKNSDKKVVTYGLGADNLWQAFDLKQQSDGTIFKIRKEGVRLGEFKIKLFGEHNALNALSAIIVGLELGLELEQIKQILKDFSGAERRFDVLENKGVIFVDDYGHHPSEIKTTLKAVRQRYPKNQIWCVFQPHMASRTKAFLAEFARSFSEVDQVIFADIFASAREKSLAITARDLTNETKKYQTSAIYGGSLDEITKYLKNNLKPGMILVTMGAGDVYKIRDKLINFKF
ncbi:MAG: UDP-N-acetylmuramate--L-alanine ligase [Candidatus Buchananbacteria bacterium RIFCSPHIGHO2_01_FULL_39_14]|uniref:UDP-N-acetylmuramate--L-alanine ligase n=2 Tax=Candidatus Buchananiibacteriota TaxID=1817903 RepID=A0A1G1YPS7_9BACT|nr:MAG: UDP-N-acetylmuramate--L-alanine ligase [Candidatus Buchananbacteria bacterium RIFCSPHIGHO2_01_FULL_39_14]OGY49272.1 MAG: UDP-N-acetylmuramate--L-alanine ligase [Candidatus Buchananbacteria bacterium RIFCSPHIGHO2_02_FULL_39_17]OGY54314.1 MAG: UDP-N-acetylmuramate--L-alanine ligase [Candidatus Buchananbacteria bacterium RIFCSPLOWO2_01_FULL_40_23b]